MSDPSKNLEDRAIAYVNARGAQIKRELGHGKDGTVYATSMGTAVKVFVRADAFNRELACYERFTERGAFKILAHAVPRLLHWDDELLILEMNIVHQPFLLDFASAYLDYPPDFSEEILEQWEAEKRELFGKNWSKVLVLMEVLKNEYDIYLFDVHPGNITFADDTDGSSPAHSP